MKKKTAWIIIGVIVAIIVVGNVGWFVHTQQHSQSSSSNRSGMMGGRSGSSGHSMMGGNSSGRAQRNSDTDVPLKTATTAAKKLAVPPILKPTKKSGDSVYYTLKAEAGTTT